MSTSLFGTLAAQSRDDDDFYIQVLYVPSRPGLRRRRFIRRGWEFRLEYYWEGFFVNERQ